MGFRVVLNTCSTGTVHRRHSIFARTSDCQFDERGEQELPVADTIAERFECLPKRQVGTRTINRTWHAVIGMDFGWSAGAQSWVVWVWTKGIDRAFVLLSRKVTKVHDDEFLKQTIELVEELQRQGISVHNIIGDINATRLGTGDAWNEKLDEHFRVGHVRIEKADKADKDEQMLAMNLDLIAGKISVVAGDPLDIEGRFLRWKAIDPENPKRPEIDKNRLIVLSDGKPIRPKDHCLDSARYSAKEIPFLFQEKPKELFTREKWLAEVARRANGD